MSRYSLRKGDTIVGFFDSLFGGDSEEKFVKRHVKRITNKFGQKEIRHDSYLALAQRGTPEAALGLLQRFTINLPDTISDEKEKRQVITILSAMGEDLVSEPLREYLRDPKQNEIAMGLIALEEVEGTDALCKEIIHLLETSDPGDAWTSDRKLQIINQLDNYDFPDAAPALLPYLEDLDDDVVFRAIEVLDAIGSDSQLRDSFMKIAVDEDTSMRVRNRILEIVLGRKWHLATERKALEPLLPHGWFFTKRDHLKRTSN